MERDTLSSELKYIEDEVAALKSAQPFYDGQLKMGYYASGAAYDFEFLTTKNFTEYDIRETYRSTTQENPVLEVYLKFFRADMSELGIKDTAQYLTNYLTTGATYVPQAVPIILNASTLGLPIGTTVRIKRYILSTAPISITFSNGEVRP